MATRGRTPKKGRRRIIRSDVSHQKASKTAETNPDKRHFGTHPSSEEADAQHFGTHPSSKEADAQHFGTYPSSKEADAQHFGTHPSSEEADAQQFGTYPSSKEADAQHFGTHPSSKEADAQQFGTHPSSKEADAQQFGTYPSSKEADAQQFGTHPSSKEADAQHFGTHPSSKEADAQHFGTYPSSEEADAQHFGTYPSSKEADAQHYQRLDFCDYCAMTCGSNPICFHCNPLRHQGDARMGLPNLGNTCYFNAAMNSLYSVPQMKRYFASLSQITDHSITITKCVKTFMPQYGRNRLDSSLLRQIRGHSDKFPSGQQCSSFTFILSLLDKFDEEANRTSLPPMAEEGNKAHWSTLLQYKLATGCKPLHEAFSIIFEDKLTCTKCNIPRTFSSYRRSLSLNLSPPPKNQSTFAKCGRCLKNWISPEKITLYSCLNAFFINNRDEKDAPHWCPECKNDEIHESSKSLVHVGSVLMIYLQRFHSPDPWAPVQVDFYIDMSMYLTGAGTYSLRAAVNHSGDSISGHFTCYAKIDKKWTYFNDSVAEQLDQPSEECLQSCELFIYTKDD